jgi:two-component system sensor histidine kinase YesM
MNIELASNESIPRRLDKFIDFFSGINLSIRTKIMAAFFVTITLLVAVNSVMIVEMLRFNRQYDAIITNITTANTINGYIKPAIDTEMWNIVAGKTEFEDGNQYQIIAQVNSQIESMMANTDSDKSRIKLEVVRRTMATLTSYIDKMGEQMAQGSQVDDNELVLDNIRGVSEVVEESVQDYILFEVRQAEQRHIENQARFNRLLVVYFVLLPCVVGFSIAAAWVISASVHMPIKKLHDMTTTITRNDLKALVSPENANEITELGINFNIMVGKIRELLDAKVREQRNLKKAELRALQAQVNPHFLYNTLDTIVWMEEENQTRQVIEIVHALSSFFRIALSKGMDWIPIRQEIEHVRSYLQIQKLRYQGILDYRIEVDEEILDGIVLKLTLQPLAENALYHGIKNKRGGGTIVVRAARAGPERAILEVEDDGVGLTPYKLEKTRTELNRTLDETASQDVGFGLANVNQRIKLYYGKEYGLSMESQYQSGTKVTITIPLQEAPS